MPAGESKDIIPQMYLPATITAVSKGSSCPYWDGEENDGREYKLVSPNGVGLTLKIEAWSGGYAHSGEFDADGEWPEVGDKLFAVESSYGYADTDDGENAYEWSAVRIKSTKGDMRAIVRLHDDPYDYGAGLHIKFGVMPPVADGRARLTLVPKE